MPTGSALPVIAWRTGPSEALRWNDITTTTTARASVAATGITGSTSRRTFMRRTTQCSTHGSTMALTASVMPAITQRSTFPVAVARTPPAMAMRSDWAATA